MICQHGNKDQKKGLNKARSDSFWAVEMKRNEGELAVCNPTHLQFWFKKNEVYSHYLGIGSQ